MGKEQIYEDGPVKLAPSKKVEGAINQERIARAKEEESTRLSEQAQQEFNLETERRLRVHDREIRWLKLKKDVDDMKETADEHGHLKELGLAIRFFRHAVEFAIHEGIVPEKLKKYFTGLKRTTYALAASAVISAAAIGYVVYKNHGLLTLETTVSTSSSLLAKTRTELESLTRDTKGSVKDLSDTLARETDKIKKDSQKYTDEATSKLDSAQAERIKQAQTAYEGFFRELNTRLTTNQAAYEQRFFQAERELEKLSPTGSVIRIAQETKTALEQAKEQIDKTVRDVNALNNAGYGLRIKALEKETEAYTATSVKGYSNANERLRILEQKEPSYQQTLRRIEERIQKAEEENARLRIENKTLRATPVKTNSFQQ